VKTQYSDNWRGRRYILWPGDSVYFGRFRVVYCSYIWHIPCEYFTTCQVFQLPRLF